MVVSLAGSGFAPLPRVVVSLAGARLAALPRVVVLLAGAGLATLPRVVVSLVGAGFAPLPRVVVSLAGAGFAPLPRVRLRQKHKVVIQIHCTNTNYLATDPISKNSSFSSSSEARCDLVPGDLVPCMSGPSVTNH